MISETALARAVERELISDDQADGLRAIERELATPARQEADDDEKLRFLTGFADIFVTLGLALFLGALAFLMDAGTGSTLSYAGLALASWLLAEFFTHKRRMALPSIVLLVVFVASVFVLSAQIFAAIVPGGHRWPWSVWIAGTNDVIPLAMAALVTVGLAALHYVRFRVPITIAAATAALCVLAMAIVAGIWPAVGDLGLDVALFVCGLAVFVLAMRFDMSDPKRETRRTDIAFWLHLLAAPLIVHPLVEGLLHGMDERLTPGAAAGIIWVFLALGLVAVVIDRRAILVSGLVYAGVAFGTLFKTAGLTSYVLPTVLLTLGAFILLLSAGWSPLRRAILRRLPAPLASRLPHPLVTPLT